MTKVNRVLWALAILFCLFSAGNKTSAVFAGGRAATSSGSGSSTGSNSATGPLELHAMVINWFQPPDPNGAFWKDMEAKYNVKYTVDWVQDTAYTDKLSLILSTNSLPDLVFINDITIPSVIKGFDAGQFMDLTSALDFSKYPNLGKINSAAWTASKYKGKNYVFPRSRGHYNLCFFVRGDILKRNNLGVPKTLDEFTNYLNLFKQTTGNIPLQFFAQQRFQYFAGAFGPGMVKPVFTSDNTGIVPYYFTEAYAKEMEFFRDCYAKGLLSQEFALIDESQTENLLFAGKAGFYIKNIWHRYRLEEEVRKTIPDAELWPMYSLKGPNGTSVFWDKGFLGGMAVNAKMDAGKFARVLDYFEKTADPANYNYFTFGIENQYWNLVEGFPQLTEAGKKDVSSSFPYPFVTATDLYNKVDSPLAPPAYNLEMRKSVGAVDQVAAEMGYAPFMLFDFLNSLSFARFWAVEQDEFMAFSTEVITGQRPVAEFRAYQQRLMQNSDVQAAMKEYKQIYDELGLANWKAPAL